MKKRMIETGARNKSGALESLRARGMKAQGFAERYDARDAIMRAARLVRKMRADAGFTQTQLAERAGMSQPEISRLEAGSGKQGPSVETINRLAHACSFRFDMRASATASPLAGG